jgi:hypothetical protein
VTCHIRVPHGGKVSRLIAASGNPSEYPNNLPARYSANGEGLPAGAGQWVSMFTKLPAGSTYDASSCQAGCNIDQHSYGDETW